MPRSRSRGHAPHTVCWTIRRPITDHIMDRMRSYMAQRLQLGLKVRVRVQCSV